MKSKTDADGHKNTHEDIEFEVEQTTEKQSATGRYKAIITTFKPVNLPDSEAGHKQTAIGRPIIDVFETENGRKLHSLSSDHSIIPLTFIEDHPSGHDYLVCGEYLNDHAMIELDTGRRVDRSACADYSDDEFYWTAHAVSPDKKFLAVDGCYWAFPYQIVIFDFSDPMTLPMPEIGRWLLDSDMTWQPDGTLNWSFETEYLLSDGTLVQDLPADIYHALEAEQVAECSVEAAWHPDTGFKELNRTPI